MESENDFLKLQIRRARELVATGYYNARPRMAVPEHPELTYGIRMSHDFPIIAEVKLATPQNGVISSTSARDLIEDYITGGAAGLSVLTEPTSFEGSLTILENVKDPDMPVLMKDFIVSEQQLEAAKRFGASAVLLIQGIFDIEGGKESRDALVSQAHELGLEVLLEGHGELELKRIMESEADIIGINQRNLHDLTIAKGHAMKLLPMVGRDDRQIVVLSGIHTKREIMDFRDAWADAVLIGTELASNNSPKTRLMQLAVMR
ncbi:MAG: indole-3-glycerol-phosphate synthase [Methanomassiliicoccales archaeon]|jgi:indole-3-glycerol phosphate synthase